MPAPSRTPEQQLAWEAERRPYAAFAAGGAAATVLGGALYTATVAFRDYPQVGLIQAITPALQGRPRAAVDPHVALARFYDAHTASLVIGAAISGVGALLMAYVLFYLAEATRARRPEFPAVARWLPVGGAVFVLVAGIGSQLAFSANAHDYLNGPQTGDALDDIRRHGAAAVFGYLVIPGQLALAFAFVFIALNAMRAGLLTRFMGVLGIIVGVLFVIQLGPLPIVQAFWLGALVPLIMLRWPPGQPPAWITGKAEPWPSSQDVRRERERQQAHAEAKLIKEARSESDEPAEPVRPRHPSSKKRRKKRR